MRSCMGFWYDPKTSAEQWSLQRMSLAQNGLRAHCRHPFRPSLHIRGIVDGPGAHQIYRSMWTRGPLASSSREVSRAKTPVISWESKIRVSPLDRRRCVVAGSELGYARASPGGREEEKKGADRKKNGSDACLVQFDTHSCRRRRSRTSRTQCQGLLSMWNQLRHAEHAITLPLLQTRRDERFLLHLV